MIFQSRELLSNMQQNYKENHHKLGKMKKILQFFSILEMAAFGTKNVQTAQLGK